MLWAALATFPLMAAVQLICARIGLVTGRGLTGAVRRHYPRPFLYAACLLLLAANVFNIAADLAGMADAAQMLTGIPSRSEERRVGKECRSRWSQYHQKKKEGNAEGRRERNRGS